MFLSGGSQGDVLLVRHSSFFSSPVEPIQAFGVDHILFPRFKRLLMPVLLIFIHFSLFNCSGVLKISQKARLVFQDQLNLFRGCYLILAI